MGKLTSEEREALHNEGQRDGAADRDNEWFHSNRRNFVVPGEREEAYEEGWRHGYDGEKK